MPDPYLGCATGRGEARLARGWPDAGRFRFETGYSVGRPQASTAAHCLARLRLYPAGSPKPAMYDRTLYVFPTFPTQELELRIA